MAIGSLGSLGAIAYDIIANDKTRAGLDSAASSLQGAGKTMTSVGKDLSMRVTAPLTLMGTAALMTAVNFDDSMRAVQAVSGATGEQFDALREQALELGRSTRYSASEAASGMQYLAMAGFGVEEIMTAMPDMLALASAGAIDLGSAADIASNILTAFGMEAGEVGRLADVMASAAASSNTNIQQLGDAMTYVAPVANTLGMSVEETTAAIGLLSNAGIQGSLAGTTLRQSLLALIKPTGEAAEILDGYGITVYDTAGNMLPFVDVLEQLEQAQMTAAEAATIFGARAGPGMMTLIGGGADALRDYTATLQDVEGAARDMAATMEAGPGGALRTLKSATEDVMITFGDLIAEIILPLVGHLQSLANWFSGLDPRLQKFIVLGGMAAAALGPLLIVVGMMASGLGTLIGLAPLVASAWVVMTGPLLPLILILGGLVLAAWLVYDNWELIVSGLTRLWDGMTAAAGAAWGALADLIKWYINGIIASVNLFIGLWNRIKFDVPSVDLPLVGRVGGFSVGVPTIPEIPLLAEGGIVTEPILAMIGEAGPEAVIPLDRVGQGRNITIKIEGVDVNEVAGRVVRIIRREIGVR